MSPSTIRLISDGPINQEWVRALAEVESRSAMVETKASSADNVKAIEDVKPLLEDLRNKV